MLGPNNAQFRSEMNKRANRLLKNMWAQIKINKMYIKLYSSKNLEFCSSCLFHLNSFWCLKIHIMFTFCIHKSKQYIDYFSIKMVLNKNIVNYKWGHLFSICNFRMNFISSSGHACAARTCLWLWYKKEDKNINFSQLNIVFYRINLKMVWLMTTIKP